LLTGWVNQCRAWLQNKSAPRCMLPYRTLHKLFWKAIVIAENASPLSASRPYVVFGAMVLAWQHRAPVSTDLPLHRPLMPWLVGGVCAGAGIHPLAALDIGTASDSRARREMLIGFLAEPAC